MPRQAAECPAATQVHFETSSRMHHAQFPQLVSQTLRPIPARISHLALSRRLPHAPGATTNLEQLAREYNETVTFIGRQLKKDPRLKPDDVQLSFEHLRTCQSCANYQHVHAALHTCTALDIGTTQQLFVDDFVIDRWSNLVRFLNPPSMQQPVLRAPEPLQARAPRQLRFGCPCSVVRDGAGYRLWHTGNGGGVQTRVNDRLGVVGLRQPTAFVRRSANGLDGWSDAVPVRLDGKEPGGTFAIAVGAGASAKRLVAGYEGKRARACLATSTDGVDWATVAAPQGAASKGKRRSECWDGSTSFLGRAADTYVLPLTELAPPLVWYRRDFGTPGGWREIRGVHVVSLGADLPSISAGAKQRNQTGLSSWYLDRLGKLERFRRQIYSVLLTFMGNGLWLGLLTVIEWPKDLSEPTGNSSAAPQRDTTNVYLVTSRDGVHFDDEWVYAQRPLIPKGTRWSDWDSGFVLPAAQIVTDATTHRIYYEVRSGSRHEERFDKPGTIAVASWDRDRLVGVHLAHGDVEGWLTTKLFRLRGLAVVLNVDTQQACSSVTVEVLDEANRPFAGFGHESAIPLRGHSSGTRAFANWVEAGASLPHRLLGRRVKLRFTLRGAAKLYGFALARNASTARRQRRRSQLQPTPPVPLSNAAEAKYSVAGSKQTPRTR